MGAWKRFLQRMTLRSAIRQGRKSRSGAPRKGQRAGILVIFPSEPALAKSLVAPLREWLLDYRGGNVRVVVPERAVELSKKLHNKVKVIPFSSEERTRSNLPTRELRRRVTVEPVKLAVLLTEEVDPFTETLFAQANAEFRAGLFADGREGYADLLLRPNESHAPAKKTTLLLRALATFAGNHASVEPGSITERLSQETFQQHEEENGDAYVLPSRKGDGK